MAGTYANRHRQTGLTLARLFPVIPNPPQVAARLRTPQTPAGGRVLRDWQFDFLGGDLATTPDGRAVELLRPELVVAQQCVVNLLVERDSYRVYPRRFGMDYTRAQRLPRREQTRAELERQVRAQLRGARGVRDVVEPRWEDGPTADAAWLGFVVTMQAGLPRRRLRALVPTGG
jgi:hypothetical protein